MRATPGISAFNSGELGPSMEGRVDLKQYASGLFAMENFIPQVAGPARRRPGSIFVSEVRDSTKKGALTEFIFNVNESFLLEWGDGFLRFYTNHAQVQTAPNVPYEIVSPYAATDLYDANGFFQLVFIQSADVIYITHRSKNFPIYKLSHFGTTNWTLAQVMTIGGPFADQNPGTNPIVFASAQTGLGITLSASADIFDPLLMGAYFQLTQQEIQDVNQWQAGITVHKGKRYRYNGVTYEAVSGDASGPPWITGATPPTHLTGTAYDGSGEGHGVVWLFRDTGYGLVQLKTRGANPTGSAVNITNITQAKPPVVTTSSPTPANNGDLIFITGVQGMVDINDNWYRVAGKSGNTFQLQQDVTGHSPANVDATIFDPYTSGGTADNRVWTATADVIQQEQAGTVNRLPITVVGSNNATSLWAVGAWNNRDGYPSSCAFFRGRLCFGRDGRIDMSVAQDFENFSALTPNALVTADMAIAVTLPTQDAINWLVEGRIQVAGTASAEHGIQEINQSQPLGPANIASKPELRHGSRAVRPVVVGLSLLWVQTSGLKVRAMKYQFYQDNYQSDDLTAQNDTISQGGLVALAFQQEPDTVVWFLRSDGLLLGLTFNEEQAVVAWHRHPMTNGIVESVACIPAPDGSQDELWMIVNRMINGATHRYVEYLAPHFLTGDSLVNDAFYLDCAKTITSPKPTLVIPGLSFLEGQAVRVLADGSAHPDCVVLAGQITLQRPAANVVVGLRIPSKLTTMPLEFATQGGTAQAKMKRVTNVSVRFLNTLGGELGNDDKQLFEDCEFRQQTDPMDQPVPIFNGIFPRDGYDFNWPEGYEQEGKLTYRNDSPFPATVVAIYPEVQSAD